MFQVDERLFNLAKANVENANDILKNKKFLLDSLSSISEAYEGKSEVIGICSDIDNIQSILEALNSNMANTQMMYGMTTDFEMLLSGLSLNGELTFEALETIINEIQKSAEFTADEKAKFWDCYQKQNLDGFLLLFSIHQINKELTSIDKEIKDIETQIQLLDPLGTESHVSNEELMELDGILLSLQNQKASLVQDRYNYDKAYEKTTFCDIYNLFETGEYKDKSAVEEAALGCFEYIKQNYQTPNGGYKDDMHGYLGLVTRYIEEYVGDVGDDVAEILYQDEIVKYLASNADFISFLEENDVVNKPKNENWDEFIINYSSNLMLPENYSYLNQAEREYFVYLYNTDKERSKEYLDVMEDTVNHRQGEELAAKDIEAIMNGETSLERVLTSYGSAILPGVVSWGDNAKTAVEYTLDLFELIEADGTKSANQYRIQCVQEMLATTNYAVQKLSSDELLVYKRNGSITEEQYNRLSSKNSVTLLDLMYETKQIDATEYAKYTNFGNIIEGEKEVVALSFSYGIGNSTGNMLPAMATSVLVSGLTGSTFLGKYVANVMMFVSTTGNALNEVIRTGQYDYNKMTAYEYALLSGISETTTGFFLGKIPFISKMDDAVTLSKKFWIQMAWNSLQEGGEEAIQPIIDSTIKSILYGEPIVLEDLTYETIYGLFAGIILSGNMQIASIPIQTARGNSVFLIDELATFINSDGTINVDGFVNKVINQMGENLPSSILNNLDQLYDINGMIGVDQGVFKKLNPRSNEYKRLVGTLQEKYGFCLLDAVKVLTMIDSTGACSYAAVANQIVFEFKDKPQQFEQTFGFPLYITNDQGNKVLNSAELLMDMYVFTNTDHNGGKLFATSRDLDSYKITTHIQNTNTKEQVYMSYALPVDVTTDLVLINNYLHSKDIFLQCTGYGLYNSLNPLTTDLEGLKRKVQETINLGNCIQFGSHNTDSKKAVDLYSLEDLSKVKKINSAHAMTILSYNQDGVIVNTWGELYLVTWDDLINSNVSLECLEFYNKSVQYDYIFADDDGSSRHNYY